MDVLGILMILSGLASTFLIISSFNTFTTNAKDGCGEDYIFFKYAKPDKRIQCPKFLYLEKFDPERTVSAADFSTFATSSLQL